MVQQPRRRNRRRKFLGSHQRAWIWGRHAVVETLRAGFWKPLELRISDELGLEQRTEVENLTAGSNLPLKVGPFDELTQLCGTTEHQGYAARMPEFVYADIDELFKAAPPLPCFAVLDGIQDPHNFGAILRSADAMAIDAVLIGETYQSPVTSQVVRSSAGAVNHVPIGRVADLEPIVKSLAESGFQIAAASEQEGVVASEADFRRPTALIIGNEGRGVRLELLQHATVKVMIPQFGHVGSLNAAVSAGILFYEVQRQRSARTHET